jgi:chemotaxis protein methyltransferase CheR
MTTLINQAAIAKPASISSQNYTYIQQYIYEKSGIVLDADKNYLLETRLSPILQLANLTSLDALCHRLRRDDGSSLARSVIDAMTTNETLFFRDAALFEALRTCILPPIIERTKGKRKLRIWSAAASSGQEAYSLAMLWLEMKCDPRDLEILGTDLSERMLERAREGRYVQFEVSRGLPAPYLVRYFRRENLDWRIKECVRDMVCFDAFDLRDDMLGLGSFDLVLCRNVLIYFDQETRNAVLDSIEKVLNRHGILLLGCAEAIHTLRGRYERRRMGHTTYYQIIEGRLCD